MIPRGLIVHPQRYRPSDSNKKDLGLQIFAWLLFIQTTPTNIHVLVVRI